jgi:hypothetical protein
MRLQSSECRRIPFAVRKTEAAAAVANKSTRRKKGKQSRGFNTMRLVTTILLLLFLSCASCVDPAERARLMLQKMTLEEKITMCHGGLTKCTELLV